MKALHKLSEHEKDVVCVNPTVFAVPVVTGTAEQLIGVWKVDVVSHPLAIVVDAAGFGARAVISVVMLSVQTPVQGTMLKVVDAGLSEASSPTYVSKGIPVVAIGVCIQHSLIIIAARN